MSKTIKWGILGTGYIAKEFATGLSFVTGGELWGVASRSLDKAEAFINEFGGTKSYNSYEALAADPEIDVVYIATPHHRHKQDCILCLEANKAILCEKPFAINHDEAKEIIELARQKQLFCMEAMWMRFIPSITKVKSIIDSGQIGEVTTLTADFGVPTYYNPDNRFFNKDLGGGALLDRGVYTLSLAIMLFGEPLDFSTQAGIGETGVDEQSALILRFAGGKLAILHSSLRTYTSNEATISGTKGKITLQQPFYRSDKISLVQFEQPSEPTSYSSNSGLKTLIKQNPTLKNIYYKLEALKSVVKSDTILEPYEGNGYNYEAAEVVRCLQKSQIESSVMPWNETLLTMKLMEEVAGEWHK